MIPIGRGMVKTVLGAIGYIIAEPTNPTMTPILCFHSSPRSSDEFLEILPLLAESGRRVVALDAPGYGISENPVKSCTIDDIADAYVEVADSLGIDKFVTVGSLMGNFIGVSLASRYPDRTEGCICANLFYYPPQPQEKSVLHDDKAKVEGEPIPDSWELKEDGSHLVDIHNRRKWLDPELNVRVVQGELTYLVNRRARYAQGISIEDLSEYDFEPAAKKAACPTLCIKGDSAMAFFDMIGFHGTQQFEAGCKLFSDCEVTELAGPMSTINMINQVSEEFVTVCKDFLNKRQL